MPETKKFYDISTAHLTEEVCNGYLNNDDSPICAYEYEFGWFIPVPDNLDEYKNLPECLLACLQWAKNNNLDMIQIDCDGYTIEELPQYDW